MKINKMTLEQCEAELTRLTVDQTGEVPQCKRVDQLRDRIVWLKASPKMRANEVYTKAIHWRSSVFWLHNMKREARGYPPI